MPIVLLTLSFLGLAALGVGGGIAFFARLGTSRPMAIILGVALPVALVVVSGVASVMIEDDELDATAAVLADAMGRSASWWEDTCTIHRDGGASALSDEFDRLDLPDDDADHDLVVRTLARRCATMDG